MSANPVQRKRVVLGERACRVPRPLISSSKPRAAAILVLPKEVSNNSLQDLLANIHELNTTVGNVLIDASLMRTLPAEIFGAICAAAHSAERNGHHLQLLVHPASTVALQPHNGMLVRGVVGTHHPIDIRTRRHPLAGGPEAQLNAIEVRLQELRNQLMPLRWASNSDQ